MRFTRSKEGSKQGQLRDLEEETRPMLPSPAWVEALRSEIRAIGDVVRLREALAVAHRDIERFRIERDRLLKMVQAERTKAHDLEQALIVQMKRFSNSEKDK